MDLPNTRSSTSALRRLQERIPDFLSLMRVNKPIGTFLLLWPTLTALWIASEGKPDYLLLVVFVAGVALMRAAGCVINDLADKDWDGLVTRTQARPLAQKKIQPHEALALFTLLCLSAFGLVCLTNLLTIKLSVVAVILASLYPFTKRFTYFPQIFLGAAFSFGIPMAFSAVLNKIPTHAWLLFTFNWVWTVAYDTQYALVDKADDLKAGIKSTAIFFDQHVRLAIIALQILCLVPLMMLAKQAQMAFPFIMSILVICGLFAFQNKLTIYEDPQACFRAFLSNAWVGFTLFIGTSASYYVSTITN